MFRRPPVVRCIRRFGSGAVPKTTAFNPGRLHDANISSSRKVLIIYTGGTLGMDRINPLSEELNCVPGYLTEQIHNTVKIQKSLPVLPPSGFLSHLSPSACMLSVVAGLQRTVIGSEYRPSGVRRDRVGRAARLEQRGATGSTTLHTLLAPQDVAINCVLAPPSKTCAVCSYGTGPAVMHSQSTSGRCCTVSGDP